MVYWVCFDLLKEKYPPFLFKLLLTAVSVAGCKINSAPESNQQQNLPGLIS